MTPSSSEWPKRPIQVRHIECDTTWDLYSPHWPPRFVVCPGCAVPLKMVAHDTKTDRIAFRRI